MKKVELIFSMGFSTNPGKLQQGRLMLRDIVKNEVRGIWTATSSIPGRQGVEGFHQKGGLIPPAYRLVGGVKGWLVDPKPINLKATKGVEGNFYRILPYAVTTDKGGQRGDFGIHLDANAPGSLGCIVMNKKQFTEFEAQMSDLRSQKVELVDLVVVYS
jgi:hypothetical protein